MDSGVMGDDPGKAVESAVLMGEFPFTRGEVRVPSFELLGSGDRSCLLEADQQPTDRADRERDCSRAEGPIGVDARMQHTQHEKNTHCTDPSQHPSDEHRVVTWFDLEPRQSQPDIQKGNAGNQNQNSIEYGLRLQSVGWDCGEKPAHDKQDVAATGDTDETWHAIH